MLQPSQNEKSWCSWWGEWLQQLCIRLDKYYDQQSMNSFMFSDRQMDKYIQRQTNRQKALINENTLGLMVVKVKKTFQIENGKKAIPRARVNQLHC